LEPEVLVDALADVTGVWDQFGDEPLGTRAVSLFHPGIPAPALDILGRCARDASCEVPAASAGLARKLHLINGSLINRRISDPDSRLHRLLAERRSAAAIIDEFYVRGLGRFPSSQEKEYWAKVLQVASDESARAELVEDILWSLLTCQEFVTNH
jgi:hypothetical protein